MTTGLNIFIFSNQLTIHTYDECRLNIHRIESPTYVKILFKLLTDVYLTMFTRKPFFANTPPQMVVNLGAASIIAARKFHTNVRSMFTPRDVNIVT